MQPLKESAGPHVAHTLDDIPSHAEFLRIIGTVARQVREARQWTPEEVSGDLGRTVEEYRAIERGELEIELADADRLSVTLGVSLDRLLDREPLDLAEIAAQEQAIEALEQQVEQLEPSMQWAVLMMLEYYVITSPRRRWPDASEASASRLYADEYFAEQLGVTLTFCEHMNERLSMSRLCRLLVLTRVFEFKTETLGRLTSPNEAIESPEPESREVRRLLRKLRRFHSSEILLMVRLARRSGEAT